VKSDVQTLPHPGLTDSELSPVRPPGCALDPMHQEVPVGMSEASAQVVSLSERQLLPRYVRGDFAAFESVVALYRAPIFGYLVRCGVPPATRDDLFQDIFIRIHTSAATYRPELPLKSWIFTIAANVVRTYFRRLKAQQDTPLENTVEPADDQPDGQRWLEAREAATWLDQQLGLLPLPQREVITLSCMEQMSHEDIARTLDMPVNTVKTHLRRGRLTLAQAQARAAHQLTREVSS